ncbi:Brp/Blh family beta-carotene 15,15'-dioxygenase [Halobaculum lipolyticum]|uniref:Probable beta-carotene 15,15'-dioxygenase n=1 Tax=Halobaculum lipolyticum TaxID=3032001 RepID=A0ABD5WHZ8_9EURY|nr:Brp/Blh family beta-carotene 15,15'-dioxygenase [Halobaculum sp. DT31]
MAVAESLSPTLSAALDRWGVRASWVALALAAPFALLAPSLSPTLRYAPFLASMLLFGLPHGAVDHLVPDRLAGTGLARSVGAVVAVYAVLGAGYGLWWAAAPVSAFVAFVAVTLLHWGQGDVYALLVLVGADHLPTRAERALALVVRGGLPMLVPLLGHPDEYRRVAGALVGLFAADAAALAPVFAPATRLGVAVGFGAATLLALALGARRVRRGAAARRPWLVDAGETLGLWAYFLLVPPVVGIGLYFCFWHATRHIARLELLDPGARETLAAGDLGGTLRRFARDAVPATLGGLVVVAGVWAFAPRPTAGPEGLLAVYLVAIAVLTLPHVAVVTWMDLRQGVW